MTINEPKPNGWLTNIATDDINNVYFLRVKLVDGTPNSELPIAGDTGGIAVSVTEHTACIDVTPVLTVHATYVANDFVGTTNTAMTFANCARVNGGTGTVIGVVLVDFALQSIAGELWLFDTAPAGLPADSAPFTITDADAARCIGVIPFSTYFASVLNSVSPVGNLTFAFQCLPASRSLYGAFVTRGAPAYASGDLTFRLRVLQD